jgi:hypothetical protein
MKNLLQVFEVNSLPRGNIGEIKEAPKIFDRELVCISLRMLKLGGSMISTILETG